MITPRRVVSRDNALLQRVRKLTRAPGGYRKQDAVWLEGEHLCSALLARGRLAPQSITSESAWAQPHLQALARSAREVVLVPDALFAGLSGLDHPAQAGIGYVLDAPGEQTLQPDLPSVVLDRVQDAGNVGSILRSASALGFAHELALEGSAALWSPKVLRAGMGAHFGLRLVEGLEAGDLERLAVPLLAASAHAGDTLGITPLPWPCAWVFGHEGQGIEPALMARCAHTLRIPQPGGEESLNVAAAAAICLYESSRGRW